MPLLNHPSITQALATSPNGIYEPPLPPIKETMALNVVSEITYHGRTQNINKIYLRPTYSWERARESLRWASEGWQMRKIGEAQSAETESKRGGDMDGNDVDVADRGEGERSNAEVAGEPEQAEVGDSPWKGKYQVVDKKGVPGKEVFDLRDERDWKILRKTVVKEGKSVVVWDVSPLLLPSLPRLAQRVSANANGYTGQNVQGDAGAQGLARGCRGGRAGRLPQCLRYGQIVPDYGC